MDVTLAQMTAGVAVSPAQPMPDATIDAETTNLAARAQAGDMEAFCALIDLHQRAARRVAAAALGESADVEEAVQDACITAWRRLGKLEDPAAFRAWLMKITWRKALDRRRSMGKWLKRFAGVRGHETDVFAGIVDSRATADRELLSNERDRIVAQMIRSLPGRLRDPFLLAANGDHRYDDIAQLLSIPVGTVKWRVSEARRVLREKLQRVGF
jgi:RNA polymerase sigma-70 factor, ECF subfamily